MCMPPLLGQVVAELQDYSCKKNHNNYSRAVQHALVMGPSGHVQPDPNLPNLLIQPFNQTPHMNLTHLIQHAWLLESQLSNNRASMRQ